MYPEERKAEYDELFEMMTEEFEYLCAHRRAGLHMITGDDIARWKEFLKRINKLKSEAMQ